MTVTVRHGIAMALIEIDGEQLGLPIKNGDFPSFIVVFTY